MPDPDSGRLDSFATFLSAMQSDAPAKPATLDSSMKFLAALGDSPKALKSVQTEAGLDFIAFSDTMNTMLQQNLVQVSGQPGQETIGLTPAGRDVKSKLK